MIPQVFHFVWTGPPMPDHLRAYMATWEQVNADWDCQLWDEAALAGWMTNQDLFDRADEFTRSVGQFRADIARYEILHRHGGIYVDVDFEARKPLDDLIVDTSCFAAWERDGVWINNAIVGAEPGHPLFAELIAGLPANVERRIGKRPNILSGPQYLTPIARRHDITVFPAALFYPYSWSELERSGEAFPDAYAVHHWANRRAKLAGHA